MLSKIWIIATLLVAFAAGQDVVYDYVIAGAGTAGMVGTSPCVEDHSLT